MSPIIRSVLAAPLLCFLCNLPSALQAQAGTYAASGKNDKFSVVVSIQSIEDIPGSGVFRIVGQVGFLKRGTNELKKYRFQTQAQLGSQSQDLLSTFSYNQNGVKKKASFILKYDASRELYLINLGVGPYGRFRVQAKLRGPSKIDLSGSWQFSDGTFATIEKLEDGLFEARWIGLPPFHTELRGSMRGRFRSGIWTGNWLVSEGSVLVHATFKLSYFANTQRLIGNVTTAQGASAISLTKLAS